MTTRLPALPLFTADPYFSVWMAADKLTDADTTHWCGITQPIYGFVTVDGTAFRFMGMGETPALKTKDIIVTPCTTTAVYENEVIRMELSFTTPFLPDDLDRLSTPICLVKTVFTALDGKKHDIGVEWDFSEKLTYNGQRAPEVAMYDMSRDGLSITAMGRIEQKILCHSGDGITIDWGYLYTAGEGLTVSRDKGLMKLVSSFTLDGTVSTKLLVGYDDIASILYFGMPAKSWYARNGKNFVDALTETYAQFNELLVKCAALDKTVTEKALAVGGEDYAYLISAVWRHTFAAHKLIADGKGNPVLLSKENNSNGCIGTVDVSYPSTPIFLYFCPELVNALCRPVLEFANMPIWKNYDFAPHDVGRYPIVNGQVYSAYGKYSVGRKEAHQPPFYLMSGDTEVYDFKYQMPVEECGNMLVMLYTAIHYGASKELAKAYLPTCRKWVKYLLDFGEDPGNQLCTDDFAGHLARNINLSAKAVVGVACFGRLLNELGEDGEEYIALSKKLAESWLTRAKAEDGSTYLTFDKTGWSMKYNLAWDKALGLELLPESFYREETKSYLPRMNRYGLPLDSRATYTKSDWMVWCAAMDPDGDVSAKIYQCIADFLKETTDRVPFSDWYFTDAGVHKEFIARSVQGGLFMPFLMG